MQWVRALLCQHDHCLVQPSQALMSPVCMQALTGTLIPRPCGPATTHARSYTQTET